MDETILGTGAIRKEEYEADQRDFVVGNVLGIPTDEQLSKVPEVVDLTLFIKETINQGCVPRCTATSLCHLVNVQNAIEEKTLEIMVDDVRQWIDNQGKKNSCTGETGDLLENALKGLNKNGVPGKIRGQYFIFKMDGYAFESRKQFSFDKLLKLIAFRLQNAKPLYSAFRGNGAISKEIDIHGRRSSVITMKEQTYGHACLITGIDFKEKDLIRTNSRNHNRNNAEGQKKLSSFRMSFDVFEKLLKNNIMGRRYRITYDKANMLPEVLFDDYAKGSGEQGEAVKRAKDNGIVNGVPTSTGSFRLEPERALKRIEMILVLFRFSKWILGEVEKICKKYLAK